MFTILTSENRDIFMIEDFNYDTFKLPYINLIVLTLKTLPIF